MNKFSFNRFQKVVVRDFHNTLSLYGMSMLVMMLVPSAIWLIGLVFGLNYADADGTDLVMRHMVVIIMAYLAAAIAPLKIYNSCNLRGKGNYFAMLPATLGEKFCSMLLYCFIVSPLAVFCGAYLVDTLLTLLPFGPNKDFLWNEPQWLNSLGEEINFGLPRIVLIFATQIFSYSAVFMFANTIFKKHKFIFTVLWLMLIGYVVSIISIPILMHVDWSGSFMATIAKWVENTSPDKVLSIITWIGMLLNVLIAAVFSFFTYRRLKKMQY